MLRFRSALVFAAAIGTVIALSGPAAAGHRTGTWRYMPQQEDGWRKDGWRQDGWRQDGWRDGRWHHHAHDGARWGGPAVLPPIWEDEAPPPRWGWRNDAPSAWDSEDDAQM